MISALNSLFCFSAEFNIQNSGKIQLIENRIKIAFNTTASTPCAGPIFAFLFPATFTSAILFHPLVFQKEIKQLLRTTDNDQAENEDRNRDTASISHVVLLERYGVSV